MKVRVMVSNVNRQQMANWFAAWLHDCTVHDHTGTWWNPKTSTMLTEDGATAEFQLPDGDEVERKVFETRLRGFLDRQGERFAWIEYDGEGRLI